jgi:HK97 family phage major capsid protein
MKIKIQKLYAEAAGLHGQAMEILSGHEGKELPADKQAEVDSLLDQVEAKTAEAKRLERVVATGESFAGASNAKEFFTEGAKQDPEKGLYQSALMKFILGTELSGVEQKALSAGIAPAGGYLVQDTFLSELLVKQREAIVMRQIGRVLPPVPSGSVITPSEDADLTDATWTTEILTGAEDAIDPFGRRVLAPHPLAKRIKVSNTLLRTPGFDVEAWIRDRMSYAFSRPEENAFINGTGVNQPLGVLKTVGLPTYTTAASNDVDGDDIINWVYKLPTSYATQARILCNRAFIRKVRSMKDGGGNYIWQPGLNTGTPNTILDTPYSLSDSYDDGLDASDDWEDNALVATLGDFRYYWIADALNMSIQRLVELYAATNQVGFIGRKECDGMAVLAEAFIALKIKA